MRRGLLLDNVGIGEGVPGESFGKLVAMGATAVGTLWTAGTHHGREVYERCEADLTPAPSPLRRTSGLKGRGGPFYIVRVGGHRQTAEEWLEEANEAEWEVPGEARERCVLTFGNEPNLEGWAECPEEYGRAYEAARSEAGRRWGAVVAFACPSLGVIGWGDWLDKALRAAGVPRGGTVPALVANLYSENVGYAPYLRGLCDRLFIGEVNELSLRGEARRAWLSGAFRGLEETGEVEAAVVFIAGGKSGGAWDEGYIVTAEEVAGLGTEAAAAIADTVPGSGRGTPDLVTSSGSVPSGGGTAEASGAAPNVPSATDAGDGTLRPPAIADSVPSETEEVTVLDA